MPITRDEVLAWSSEKNWLVILLDAHYRQFMADWEQGELMDLLVNGWRDGWPTPWKEMTAEELADEVVRDVVGEKEPNYECETIREIAENLGVRP